jgi:hypothetical protein
MGQEGSNFDKSVIMSNLRQAKARIQIHRGKLLNTIHKKLNDVKTDIESGNEGMALIHVLKIELFLGGDTY